MVIKEVVKKGAETYVKVYVKDAALNYAQAFLGGCMAGVAWLGVKDGYRWGCTLVKGAKKVVGKAFSPKKPKAEVLTDPVVNNEGTTTEQPNEE